MPYHTITFTNIAERAPNFGLEEGFLRKDLKRRWCFSLVLTSEKVSAMQASEKGDSTWEGAGDFQKRAEDGWHV